MVNKILPFLLLGCILLSSLGCKLNALNGKSNEATILRSRLVTNDLSLVVYGYPELYRAGGPISIGVMLINRSDKEIDYETRTDRSAVQLTVTGSAGLKIAKTPSGKRRFPDDRGYYFSRRSRSLEPARVVSYNFDLDQYFVLGRGTYYISVSVLVISASGVQTNVLENCPLIIR